MKIVSFINPWQRDVIDRILDHCGLSSRLPPAVGRAPRPVRPAIRNQSASQYPRLDPLPKPVTKDTIRNLVKLDDAWGMPDEAKS
jgi:hypothetical protein